MIKLVHVEYRKVLKLVVIKSIVYMVFQMETAGEMLLDIIFEQFYFELVIETSSEGKGRFYHTHQSNIQRFKTGTQGATNPTM